MKKTLLLLLMFPVVTYAQLGLLGGKNIIKTNLASDVIGNYNLTYERAIAPKLSLSLGIRYMPKVGLPGFIKSRVEDLIDDKNIKLEEFQMGNIAITPELRLYLGAGKMKGFYIAPYARYAEFDLRVPLTYNFKDLTNTDINATAIFNGKFKSFSGGLLIGTQFSIARKLVLDVWIIGGHYGTSTGTIVASEFNPAIDPNDPNQTSEFKKQVESVNDKDYGPFKFKGEVAPDYKSATFTSTGAWAGVRAGGVCLGFRF